MQFTFLGYSVKKIMELELDVKDVAILRCFDDFRRSGKMNYEVIEGVKYYWISYRNIENELPFLGLGKRSSMMRMLKLRDLGVLSHYTKKEGGTFSYYALGERYKELLDIKDNRSNDNSNEKGSNDSNSNHRQAIEDFDNGKVSNIYNNSIVEESYNEDVINKEVSVTNNLEGNEYLSDLEEVKHKKEERVLLNNKGYAEKCQQRLIY